MSRWCFIPNIAGVLDRYTAAVHPFAVQFGKPVPVLRSRVEGIVPVTPIPDDLAWACAERLIAAGGQLGAAERAALGLDVKESC